MPKRTQSRRSSKKTSGGFRYTEEYLRDRKNILEYIDNKGNKKKCIKDADTPITDPPKCYEDIIMFEPVSPENAHIMQEQIVDINNAYVSVFEKGNHRLVNGDISLVEQMELGLKYHEKQLNMARFRNVMKRYNTMYLKFKAILKLNNKIISDYKKRAELFSATAEQIFNNNFVVYDDKTRRQISFLIDKLDKMLQTFAESITELMRKNFQKILVQMKMKQKGFLGDITELTQYMEAYIICYTELLKIMKIDFSFETDVLWSNRSAKDAELQKLIDDKFRRYYKLYPQIALHKKILKQFQMLNIHHMILMGKNNVISRVNFDLFNDPAYKSVIKNKKAVVHEMLCFTLFYYIYNAYVVRLLDASDTLKKNKKYSHLNTLFTELAMQVLDAYDKQYKILKDLQIFSLKTESQRAKSLPAKLPYEVPAVPRGSALQDIQGPVQTRRSAVRATRTRKSATKAVRASRATRSKQPRGTVARLRQTVAKIAQAAEEARQPVEQEQQVRNSKLRTRKTM